TSKPKDGMQSWSSSAETNETKVWNAEKSNLCGALRRLGWEGRPISSLNLDLFFERRIMEKKADGSIFKARKVMHSYDKKKKFEQSTVKFAENGDGGNGILKLGRKDLNPQVEIENKKGGEEEEAFEEQKNNKNKKIEEKENQRKETEEKENGQQTEEKKVNLESTEDQDHNRGDKNTQEAREEHYKGVDTSSAVARETQLKTTEAKNQGYVTSSEGQKVEKAKNAVFQQENKTNSSDDVTSNTNDSLPMTSGDGETVQNNSSANVAENEEKGTEPSNISDSNSVVTELSNQQEQKNSLTTVNLEATHSEAGTLETSISSQHHGMDSHDQNATLMMETSNEGEQNLETVLSEKTENSSSSTKAENKTTKEEYTNSSMSPKIVKPVKENIIFETTTAENKKVSSPSNGDDVQTDQSKNYEKIAEKEDNSVSSNTSESIIEALNNKSDSSLHQEVKEARTDLGSLPEVETQGKNSGNVAAE
ncbi:hypothetical protein GIB67_004966, partial [Kingdonia uniflora]